MQTFCSVFLMEQVRAAPLPEPDQDARSGGRPSEQDRALNNGITRHAPPSLPVCTETLHDFGNQHFRGDSSLVLLPARLGFAVACAVLRREPVRYRCSLTALESVRNQRSADGRG